MLRSGALHTSRSPLSGFLVWLYERTKASVLPIVESAVLPLVPCDHVVAQVIPEIEIRVRLNSRTGVIELMLLPLRYLVAPQTT